MGEGGRQRVGRSGSSAGLASGGQPATLKRRHATTDGLDADGDKPPKRQRPGRWAAAQQCGPAAIPPPGRSEGGHDEARPVHS